MHTKGSLTIHSCMCLYVIEYTATTRRSISLLACDVLSASQRQGPLVGYLSYLHHTVLIAALEDWNFGKNNKGILERGFNVLARELGQYFLLPMRDRKIEGVLWTGAWTTSLISMFGMQVFLVSKILLVSIVNAMGLCAHWCDLRLSNSSLPCCLTNEPFVWCCPLLGTSRR